MIDYNRDHNPNIVPYNMESLINAFPGITGSGIPCPPEAKQSVHEFVRWAKRALLSDAQLECAKFIVGVWTDSDVPTELGAFDMFSALRKWDADNKAVFFIWARNPWAIKS